MRRSLPCSFFVIFLVPARQQCMFTTFDETMSYLNHRPISDEVRPEVRDIFGKVSDVANQCPLEADLSLAQLVGSALSLKYHIDIRSGVVLFFRQCHVG